VTSTPRPAGSEDGLAEGLAELLAGQRLAVLSTHDGERPHGSLVAFAATPAMDTLVFATTRGTRKFRNLSRYPRVSLVIDSRSNRESDFREAAAATAEGLAAEVPDGDSPLRQLYLAKHPTLAAFLEDPTCALVAVRVDAYRVVQRFQEVQTFRPR
jgi:nitroimidazol reductase NimA-like FMN-containing flavoprotein (pyridoxamine 5'-phosphate oxidase superfamily)